MSKVKLTKRVVDAAEIGLQRYTLFDSEIRGFGLRVFPSGQKSWIFEYKGLEGGRKATTKRFTIGKYPDFTPDEARKAAENLRAKVKLGGDPQQAKKEQREARTIKELVALFLSDHVETKRKAGTAGHYRDILNRIVVPAIGSKKAKTLTRADVSKLHKDWSHTPFQANRILAIIGSMYKFAAQENLVPDGMNPARGIDKYKEEGRERFLATEELERLGAAIRTAETIGVPWKINPEGKTKHVPKENRQTPIGEHAAAAIRLLLFTGCRLREILHLKWSDVDFERGVLFLAKTKTGKKTIVLNAPAVALLLGISRTGVYVIAGHSAGADDEKPRSDLKRPWGMVTSLAGLDGVRIHDLRHSFASFGAGGGMGLPIIGKLLGHTQAATTQKYAHLAVDPLRIASNSIGSQIAAAMGEPQGGAEIIPLKRKER